MQSSAAASIPFSMKARSFVRKSPARMAVIIAVLLYGLTVLMVPTALNMGAISSIIMLTLLLSFASAGQTIVLIGGGFLILIQNSVYFVFNLLNRVFPDIIFSTYWHNLLSDVIIFLGLLLTIVTAKGQREALRISVRSKFTFKRREEYAK